MVVNVRHGGYGCENAVPAARGVGGRVRRAVGRVSLAGGPADPFFQASHAQSGIAGRRSCSAGELVEVFFKYQKYLKYKPGQSSEKLPFQTSCSGSSQARQIPPPKSRRCVCTAPALPA